jgi:hypothetical protein
MRTPPTRAAMAALAVTMSVLGWAHSHPAAFASEQPQGTARLSEELSIDLGCGEVEGPGTVVQLDATGAERGYQVSRENTTAYEVVIVDFKAKAFRRLFAWSKSRIVSLAVGPKMAWR